MQFHLRERFLASTFVSQPAGVLNCVQGGWCGGGVFVGVVVSVLGRSVDVLAPGADEGRGRPR